MSVKFTSENGKTASAKSSRRWLQGLVKRLVNPWLSSHGISASGLAPLRGLARSTPSAPLISPSRLSLRDGPAKLRLDFSLCDFVISSKKIAHENLIRFGKNLNLLIRDLVVLHSPTIAGDASIFVEAQALISPVIFGKLQVVFGINNRPLDQFHFSVLELPYWGHSSANTIQQPLAVCNNYFQLFFGRGIANKLKPFNH